MDFPKELFVYEKLDGLVAGIGLLVIAGSIDEAAEAGERVRVARYQLVEEGHVEAPPSFVPAPGPGPGR